MCISPSVSVGVVALLATLLVSLAPAHADLVCRLTFDDAGDLGADSSGNDHHAGITNSPMYDADGISGGSSSHDSSDYYSWAGISDPVANVVAADFTFSLWVKTTQTYGTNGAPAHDGAGIVWSDYPGSTPGPEGDTIPMALTGSQLAGWTDGGVYNSTSSINTGSWVHLVVVREADPTDGFTAVYIDGDREVLMDSGDDDMSYINRLVLGGNTLDGRYYAGLMDEFQVYNEALTDQQVAYLHQNPGEAVPEPTTALLLGLLSLGTSQRRKRRSRVG